MYILFAILLFSVLIAIHELGHFLAAKACGVHVEEFSIGMGPQLWHRQGKETVYSLRLFPIGGFCAMAGEDESTDDPRALTNAKRWKQLVILVAGAFFNFLIGVVIMLGIYLSVAAVAGNTITSFEETFPCQGEGMLQVGDTITAIDGSPVLVHNDIALLLSQMKGDTCDVTVIRDGEKQVMNDLNLIPREYDDNGTKVTKYGLYFGLEYPGTLRRLELGWNASLDFVREVWWGLKGLATGSFSLSDMTGPIGIVSTMSEVGQQSATAADAALNLLNFAAFIAVNLAVVNLLPLPALDGGRIFFVLLDSVCMLLFRREVPRSWEGGIHFVGLVLLMVLMVVIAGQDILRLVQK